MEIAVAFYTLAVILWIYFLWSRRKYYAFALKVPGPWGLPLLGIVYKLVKMEEALNILPKIAADYGTKTFFSWFGTLPLLYTIDPKVVEIVLSSPDCLNKSLMYHTFNELLGDGLISSKTPTWNTHRKLLNPAFSHKVLLNFVPTFNKASHEMCMLLDQVVGCGEVNVKDIIFKLTLKSSLVTTMGLKYDCKPSASLRRIFERGLTMAAGRMSRPWLFFSLIYKRTGLYRYFKSSTSSLFDFIKKIVMKKMNSFELDKKSKEQSDDIEKEKHIFIDLAIQIYQKKLFTLDDVIVEANTIVAASIETSATSIHTVLLNLAMQPQYQEKVFDEIQALYPNEHFDISYSDLKNFCYLDMCINEAHRIGSAIPLIGRVSANDVPISDDVIIPKGTQILISLFNLHRDKDVWGPDADTYNPDHFLPANLDRISAYSFLPFSKGPRNCIGWQYATIMQKIALVHILRKYRFTTSYQLKDLKFITNVTLKLTPLPLLEVHRR